ncbi:MAG: 3-isopropylmalate dehydratase small subunit [Methylobacteriaceae bacterium]|nr:3-isopropylmalate dehydratase small subunit [Methylobacteriaceae bacterium]
MPQPFTTIRSIALPLMRDNIDTDLIIRVERLFGAVPRDELGQYAFEAIRKRADGSLDPDCALNDERYFGANILLAGKNFGCGSAREGAVWAIAGMGIRAILAPSFGDIFVTNCYQNSLLPVVLPQARVDAMAASASGLPGAHEIVVDLESQTVIGSDGVVDSFSIPALRRRALLDGLEDIALTLKRADEIAAFHEHDARARPWAYPKRM